MKFALAVVFALFAFPGGIAVAQESQAPPPRHPFDIPFPSPEPPYAWPNMNGQPIECASSPFQLIDLGEVGPLQISAGDGCSMPSHDLISEEYKKVFNQACKLHDICYLGPGNSKVYCDDMFEWHLLRDCDHAYQGSPTNLFMAAARAQCQIAATAWRAGLETPLSSEYFNRSQAWGRQNCKIKEARPVPK